MFYKSTNLTFEMSWTTKQKLFIIESYFRHTSIQQNSIHALNSIQFKERFGCREFLSTQWSTAGSASSEPMGLCITSIVKTLTDNHTLDDRNHQGHHTTLLLSENGDCCPQPKQVCASAKSGAWNQPGVRAENFDRRSPHAALHLQDTDWTKAYTWRHEEASDHVPVVLRQDWRCARRSWQCLVFGRSTLSVVRSREL